MYRAVKGFFDTQDSDHWYNAGDRFPRDGIKVTDARIAELSGSDNRQHEPLIEAVKAQKPVEPAGSEPDADEKKPVKRKKEVKK